MAIRAGTKLTNDVTVREARSIWQAQRTMTYRQIEEKFNLRRLNGMTAFRIVQRYRRYLALSGKEAHAAAKAGFVFAQ